MKDLTIFYWDDAEVQKLTLPLLQRRYVTIVSATDEERALALCTSGSYDVAVIDRSPEKWYGERLIRAFRQCHPRTPIIGISTVPFFLRPVKDINYFLSKPFAIHDLEKAIDETIKQGMTGSLVEIE